MVQNYKRCLLKTSTKHTHAKIFTKISWFCFSYFDEELLLGVPLQHGLQVPVLLRQALVVLPQLAYQLVLAHDGSADALRK